MKRKGIKVWIYLIILLLIIPSLTGCFFTDDASAEGSGSLEIDYFVDGKEAVEEGTGNNLLLSQIRKSMMSDGENEAESLEAEIVDSSADKEELSFWEKLKLRSEERSKDDLQETKLTAGAAEEKREEKEAAKNSVLEGRGKEEKAEEDKKQEDTRKDKSDNRKNQNKEQDKEPDKDRDKETNTPDKKPKEDSVTITIRCDTAVAKGMDKDPQFSGIVPSSGVILSTTTMKIKEGDTVLNVLEAVRDKYKVQMRYTGTKESAYIEGINNLYEFDGGRWSGWMYNVNGWYPNYGAGVYVLQSGDKIEWNYTCDLGKDLGQDWLMGN